MSSSDQTYEKIPAPSGSLTTGRLISLSWLKILGLVIFLLLIGRFAVVGWTRISLNANSADGDQPAYLRLGLDIRELGQWTDGKRPPLYPALQSTFASRTWA
jgi:hypothetical protein